MRTVFEQNRFFPETKCEKPVLLYEKDDLMYFVCVK